MKKLSLLFLMLTVLFSLCCSATALAAQDITDSEIITGEGADVAEEPVSEPSVTDGNEPSGEPTTEPDDETENVPTEEERLPCRTEQAVSLEGKTIMMVGNSMLYYGNCVVYGDAGKEDYGYFYQLISANGENARVIDQTYSGKKLSYIYSKYLKKLSQEELNKVDYVVLAEANKENDDLPGTCKKIMALFPETTKFVFMCNPMMYYKNIESLLTGVEELRKEKNIDIVDWGKLVYDVYSGKVKVPGAALGYDFCSFLIDNTDYSNDKGLTVSGTTPDTKHPNPLSGYISAQMVYTAITNRSALYTDYSFCYNASLDSHFNIDAFALKYYTGTKKTNFTDILRSPADMFGLQRLIDSYLAAEGKHPLYVLKAIEPTCTSGGLSAGYFCSVCNETVKEQEYIRSNGSHKVRYETAVVPTCTKAGRTGSAYCTECGENIIKKTTLKATGHSDTVALTQAGINKNGLKTVFCTVCNATISKTKIPAVASITLSATEYVYDGKSKKPKVTVKTNEGKTLVKDKDYTVTYPSGRTEVGDYKVKVVLKDKYAGNKNLTFKIRPGVTASLTAKSYLNSVKLTWGKVTNATGYRVYRYNSKTKKYEKYTDTKKNTLKVKKLKSGAEYKFRVKAYTVVGGKTYFSKSNKYITAVTKPAAAVLNSAVSKRSREVDLSWKKITGADGYQILYSENAKFKSSKKVTVRSGAKKSATVAGLKSNKRYYFKIRAYKTLNSKKIYGPYSQVKNTVVRW